MKPINNYVLISTEDESTTSSGLYVPKTTDITGKDILKKGTVKEVSAEVNKVSKGDIVYYNKHAVTNIPQQGDVLVRIEDIYAVI